MNILLSLVFFSLKHTHPYTHTHTLPNQNHSSSNSNFIEFVLILAVNFYPLLIMKVVMASWNIKYNFTKRSDYYTNVVRKQHWPCRGVNDPSVSSHRTLVHTARCLCFQQPSIKLYTNHFSLRQLYELARSHCHRTDIFFIIHCNVVFWWKTIMNVKEY